MIDINLEVWSKLPQAREGYTIEKFGFKNYSKIDLNEYGEYDGGLLYSKEYI